MAKEALKLNVPRASSVAKDTRAGKKAALISTVKAVERKLNDDFRTGADDITAVHDAFREFRKCVLALKT